MKGITRTDYKRSRGEIKPFRKTEMLKIDDQHYLRREYRYNPMTETFIDLMATCWFDGEKFHNGVVCYTSDNVDTLFELRKQYEGYTDFEE